jgi:diguanylate cyclase (GGDEF)-like protein
MKNISTKSRHSLRFRYVVLAAIVATLLIGGSIVASMYVNKVSETNAATLQLRDTVTETIGDIRNSIWRADMALNATLISPHTTHQQIIKENLQLAEQRLKILATQEAIGPAGLTAVISDLQFDLALLKENVYRLIELREDPNWVYPMLPFIGSTLRESNMNFESSATLALTEIAQDDGTILASELYRRIDEVRDLWRLKILNFREALIRFAGLNQMDQTSQEKNIFFLHEQIQAKLAELESFKQNGELGFETELALETMQSSSSEWHRVYLDIKEMSASRIWRADINFLEIEIRPHQEQVFKDLTDLEKKISIWASHNVSAIEQAANQINFELWILSGLALTFVVLVYVMIDRSILTPVERIASAISGKSGTIERLEPLRKSSREILSLINAFNAMRLQIHHRQSALKHQALHDSLTGLPNRALLQDRLDHGIHLAHRNRSSLTVMLLDLDRFKEINDTLGHHVGDRVLQVIGERLAGTLRESDTVARLGGDEFAIILPDTDSGKSKVFVEKISATIDRVVSVENQNLYVGSSIGIAIYPDHGTDATTLIRHADIAMYQAKNNNLRHAYFEDRLDQSNIDNLSLLGDLRTEITQQSGQISLYYQPKIDLLNGRVLGVEALLRWKHPKRDFIRPDHIVRMAEQSGLIRDLSAWVLERAIRDCATWNHNDISMNVAVNLSARNLQDPKLPALIKYLLVKYNLSAEQLTLEITESAVMDDPVRAGEVLHELNHMGCELAVDDFGTGFSSLAYLKLLPVHALKIDKSFVIDMLDDENDSIIVRSTIDLAHNLGLKVIAEGVENQQAMLRLKQLKCDYAQGFYFSPPIPEPEFRDWHENHASQQAVL